MPWIVVIDSRRRSRTRGCLRKCAVAVQIEAGRNCPRQRPLLLGAPLPAMIHSTRRVLAAGTAAHDENPYGRLAVYRVLFALQPAIEPAHSQCQKIGRDIAAELRRRPEVDVAGER